MLTFQFDLAQAYEDGMAERLKAARQELRCTQFAFAKMLGCSRNHIAAVETSRTTVSASLIAVLSTLPVERLDAGHVTSFDAFWLLTGCGPKFRVIQAEKVPSA